tara:strand:- start:15991 stop:16722 length:732 start_codon:yes stop_codon:yes gene_type:complete
MLQKIVENSLSVRDSLLKSGIEADRVDQDKNLIQNSLSMVKKSEEYKLNRGFDLCIGILGLLIHAILFPFIAFAIKISSSGPVLYKQKRTGKMGVDFYCYKYRTMHLISLKSEEGKPIVTKKGDSRIFKFGQVLRKTNLDELPQIINVLKGEMSLVGPRPYPVEECKHWNNTFDDFYYRYLVKPGITGYAQVTGYRGGTLDEEHMRRRLDKDLIYVQKQNLTFDIKIIYLTIKQMVTFKTNAH